MVWPCVGGAGGKLTQPEDWKRAYAELNDFEEQLQEHNNILLKFWLHISPDEQLRRFRRKIVENYKITDDWRNREKWPAYVEAADEMFLRTSTEYAPYIIPAEDKMCAAGCDTDIPGRPQEGLGAEKEMNPGGLFSGLPEG